MAQAKGPASQEDVGQSASLSVEESSSLLNVPGGSASPTPSSGSIPNLTRSGSTPSSDQISLSSHTSIPVVGTFPLGTLKVHQIVDSPRPQRPAAPPKMDDAEMPPLEGDERAATGPSAASPPGGDVFLILELPPNSTVGCDAKAIGTAASGFKGIRDIPPGPHFIWVAAPGAMSRCGFWFVAGSERASVRVKQWDRFNEVLVDPASNFEARDQRDNVASLYPHLIPYDLSAEPAGSLQQPHAAPPAEDEAARLWRQLTSCVSEKVLMRVTGRAGVDEWLIDTSDSAVGDSSFPQAKPTQTYQTMVGAAELNFLFPETDVDLHERAAAVAAVSRVPDTSDDIVRLLDMPGTGIADADLIGELQLTFVAGLHLSNLACIEQWWHLVLKVFLRAHRLVAARPQLALAFLATFHAQMDYNDGYIATGSPQDALEGEAPRREYAGEGGASASILDIVPGNKGKLREALTLYKRRLNEILLDLPTEQQVGANKGMGEVGRAFVELEAWFWRFGWDLRTDYVRNKKKGGDVDGDEMDVPYEDDDEYQPVIVDLDSHGREVGLVSFD